MHLLKTLVVLLLFLIAGPSVASPRAQSRLFNGVSATFEIKNPIITSGQDLKIVVVYRNTSSHTISFRFGHLEEDAEVYEKGKSKPIVGGYVGEFPFLEVTLKPGESHRFEDQFSLKGWPNLAPGNYEVRFYYHLSLLGDDASIKEYQAKYPHDGYVVPWSDRRYAFILKK